MKNFTPVLLGLALVSGIGLAQAGDGLNGGVDAGNKAAPMARMQKTLGLSDEQVKQMRDIREAGGSPEEMRAVLTPEQQAKAAQLKKANQDERMDRMKKQLDLSDEQVAKIKEIRKAGGSRQDIRAVLTPEQQAKFDEARGKHKGNGPQSKQ